MDAKTTSGFDFKFETGVEMPARKGGSGTPKYDWSKFPAPKDPKDSKTYQSSVITGIKAPKTIYTSIKRYKDKLLASGTKEADLPEFSTFRETDAKGTVIGFRVFRTK